MEKRLFVQDKIVSIDKGSSRKPPTITFALDYPSYLKSAQEDSAKLLDDLIEQSMSYKFKVTGLWLTWNQEEIPSSQ